MCIFILARSIPGDPCERILGEKATQEICTKFIKAKGLDKPIPVQFSIYFMDVIRGDFGNSIRFSVPVIQILVERLPATIELSLTAFILRGCDGYTSRCNIGNLSKFTH